MDLYRYPTGTGLPFLLLGTSPMPPGPLPLLLSPEQVPAPECLASQLSFAMQRSRTVLVAGGFYQETWPAMTSVCGAVAYSAAVAEQDVRLRWITDGDVTLGAEFGARDRSVYVLPNESVLALRMLHYICAELDRQYAQPISQPSYASSWAQSYGAQSYGAPPQQSFSALPQQSPPRNPYGPRPSPGAARPSPQLLPFVPRTPPQTPPPPEPQASPPQPQMYPRPQSQAPPPPHQPSASREHPDTGDPFAQLIAGNPPKKEKQPKGKRRKEKPPRQPKKQREKPPDTPLKRKRKRIIAAVLLLLAILAALVSGGYLLNYAMEGGRNNKSNAAIAAQYRNLTDQGETSYTDGGMLQNLAGLYRTNSDTIGWLQLKAAGVDLPVMQTDNNDYYLNHDFNRKTTRYGSLFLDMRNQTDPAQQSLNLSIYGHNTRNGSMFGQLRKFRELSFYKANPAFTFHTLYREGEYVIFAVMVCNASPEQDNGNFFDWGNIVLDAPADMEAFLEEVKARSLIDTGIDVGYGDRLLNLTTCCYDFENARLVIFAREIRPDETIDTSGAAVNPSPKKPAAWK